MRMYGKLVGIFLRSGEVEGPEQKQKKSFYIIFGLISLIGILLPCCVLVGAIAYVLTLGMEGDGNGIIFLLHFVSLFAIIFGVGVIMNIFYFAGDIPHILPLPISPTVLIAAKFTTAYITEAAMEIVLLISVMIGFFLAAPGKFWTYAAALAGTFTLPIVPLCYGATLCVVLMGFMKGIRNKSTVRRLSSVINLTIVVVSVRGLGLLGNLDLERIVQQLRDGQVRFVGVLNVVFPTNYWFGEMISRGLPIYMLWYVCFHVLVLAIFLLSAKFLYLRGLMAVGVEGDATGFLLKRHARYGKKNRKPWVSYLGKEMRVLLRTPPFFMNCIAVNLLWPGLGYVIAVLQSGSVTFQRYLQLYREGNEAMQWIMTLLVLALSVLLTASNSIASSSITREGKHFYVMKYLPVSYETQLHVKALTSILVSGGFMLLYLLIAGYFIRIPWMELLYFAVTALEQIVFLSYFGVLLDTVQPKLVWDDEVHALRANRNVFYNMAYAMLIATISLFAFWGLYRFTRLPLYFVRMILFLILAAADIRMMQTCVRRGKNNLLKL
ncbi:MAG: hypothetical protein J6P60_07050 [Lachnospiraceae bacterium]|nr:hypothetical protein [Lachnospiraceae bacterium]